MTATAADRFWANVDRSDDCWVWTAHLNAAGYGRFRLSEPRRLVYAHRFAYELLVGPIPEGLSLDHLCRNRSCVRPTHLEPVTQRTNLLRGSGFAATQAEQIYCKYGHPLWGENVYSRPTSPNRRECRTCKREATRRARSER
jgi:hypothetical protein